jgi:hypothetical protein
LAKRTKKSGTVKPDDVIDAVVTEDVSPDAELVETPDAAPDVTPEDVAEIVTEDAPEIAAEPVPEPEVASAPQEPPAPAYVDSSQENSVLLPMILGGLIAGGLGYGAAYLMRPVVDIPLDQQVAMHSDEIAALQASVGAEPEGVDLDPLTTQITENFDTLSGQITDMGGRIASLEERFDTLEKQPSSDGTLQDTAVAAFQRELDELRDQTEQMSADAAAALQATRDEAAAIEQNAVENARVATARASLARVQGALESGAPFGDVLTDLADAVDAPIPDALTEVAADGIPTLGQLQADFPSAARAALATARSEGASGDESGGFGAFLRSQLNVRSVTPQEGDSADAILSRAEANLRDGLLNETIAEIATLPEVARGALSAWLTRAELRSNALAAADELNQSLTVN